MKVVIVIDVVVWSSLSIVLQSICSCCFRFRALIAGETLPFTLVVRDPMGNSFIGSLEHENPADDPKITVRGARGGGGG